MTKEIASKEAQSARRPLAELPFSEIAYGSSRLASKLGKDEILNTYPHLYSLYTDIKGKPLKQGDVVVYARENSLFFGIVLLEDIEHEGVQLEAVPHVKDMRGFLVNNGRNFLTA